MKNKVAMLMLVFFGGFLGAQQIVTLETAEDEDFPWVAGVGTEF